MGSKFHTFSEQISTDLLPSLFTFPFFYTPHPLAIKAAEAVQNYLEQQTDFEHNFGLIPDQEGIIIGKMFGVLVVQAEDGTIGYLAAFSGKLADSNNHAYFVSPVYDILEDATFYLEENAPITQLNYIIEALEQAPKYQDLLAQLALLDTHALAEIEQIKTDIVTNRAARKEDAKRLKATLSDTDFAIWEKQAIGKNLELKAFLKYKKERYEQEKLKLMNAIATWNEQIERLKADRSQRSNALQQKIFEAYTFQNALGETKSLFEIFNKNLGMVPPAGAGECAAPKLLQYAYLNNLKPIALAEFWWGTPPKSQVRKHKEFYPSCRSKCEPILGHMLKGLEVEPNPIALQTVLDFKLDIVYEDDDLLIVNKPNEVLSVPGKQIQTSIYTKALEERPEITGPVIIHRLDMATSGLLVLAKNKQAHEKVQAQFIERTIEKRYEALLEGEIATDRGTIDFPIRVDLDNRPKQLVCYEYGKRAITEYEVMERKAGKTRVYFYPITGRTHQLRMHASHYLGLNAPIVGDDLYGSGGEKLHLHAGYLKFNHPTTQEVIEFEVASPF